MFRLLPLAAVLLASLPAVADDEAYTLKRYKPKEGDVFKKTIKFTADINVTATIGGETATTPAKEGLHLVETVEVLATSADDKQPTKLKRTFEKSERTTAGKAAPNALEGKTVVTAFTDGKATHTVDDKPAGPELEALLNGDYAGDMFTSTASNLDLLPGKPVKVGDTWVVDLKKMQEASGAKQTPIDLKKSSCTGKLVKAAKKDGALWGTVELDLRFVTPPTAAADKNAPEIGEVEMTAKLVIQTCLDGTQPGETVEATMGMNNTSTLPTGGKMVWAVTGTGTTTTEPAKKK